MFELKVYRNGFQILQQPADITRGCGDIFTSSTGFKIYSCYTPEVAIDALFLRGTSKDRDSDIMSRLYFYKSMRALEEYCQFVSEKLVIKLGD